MGKRVLITGLGTFWGSRVAQALESDPTVDVIVGLDRKEPTVPLERTEYVRTDESYSILARIVKAARIDTIVHTFLVVDSTQMKSRTIHEINVIGTMNLFAAASAPSSTVRNVVVKSSTLVYGAHPKDPVWFSEESRRAQPPKAMVERSLLEVEGYVRDFAVDNPHVNVAMLRFSNVLGPDITTPLAKALELPAVRTWINDNLVQPDSIAYVLVYGLLIIGFAYFYTAIAFDPAQQAENIRKQGGFIPGIRPGPQTEKYLARILSRITLPGALFIAFIALLPSMLLAFADVQNFPFAGTSILIAVGVALETMKQIDSQLMMRNYEGFLK